MQEQITEPKLDNKVSGASIIVSFLEDVGIDCVFAYPGTSELALCESLLASLKIQLFNGRGDRESVFLAAGRSIFGSCKSASVIHGARGLTNALGAISDAHRNEIATLCIIGLPSSLSSRYLPPHGEENLILRLSPFAKAAHEISSSKLVDQQEFCKTVKAAIEDLRTLPYGPVLLGIPQNYLENSWIDVECVNRFVIGGNTKKPISNWSDIDETDMCRMVEKINEKSNIVILVDDFLLRKHDGQMMAKFAESVNAPVFQLEYRRGPVFFEQIDKSLSPNLVGYYNPSNPDHKKLVDNCDLLITIEDRNMYARNIGKLPSAQKIAITSNRKMTSKNDYLGSEDLLVVGDVESILCRLIKNINTVPRKGFLVSGIAAGESNNANDTFLRARLPKLLVDCIAKFGRVAWVDDGQIFGGILKENYHILPRGLKVFGDHGGFVGAGIGYACGLAMDSNFDLVVCSLGDHGFSNGFQSMYFASEMRSKIIFFVFNNGKSVSLTTQSAHNGYQNIVESNFLVNLPAIDYTAMATSVGVNSFSVDITIEENIDTSKIQEKIMAALNFSNAILIEFKCPQNLEAYDKLWACKGLDEK